MLEAIATGSAPAANDRDHWVQIVIDGVKETSQKGGAIPANSDDDQLRELILAGIEQCQLEGLDQKER